MENDEFKKVRIKNRTCYYFDDIIKFEDFGFSKILIDKKSYENLLVYNISFKTLIGAKPLRIRFDKVDGFIRVYDGNRYVVSFGPEIYGAIYNRLRYLISQKMLCLKYAVLGQKTFMTNKITFKMTKNAFYFTLKTRFDLEIFKLLSLLFGHV